jgi:CSLREA domain-containing protein
MRKQFFSAIAVRLSIAIFFLFGNLIAAQAATLTVTKIADTNDGVCSVADCSLREAIAVAAASGDTIEFSALFDSPQTIALTAGQLSIGKSLTITGKGANLTTVSGSNASRVFEVNSGADLTLANLTVTGGRAFNGGGIQNNESTLTIINCAIAGNASVYDSSHEGGGIQNLFGTVTILGSTISGNSVSGSPADENSEGGGIANRGTMTIVNSTISGNSINGGGQNRGGGISTVFATTTIRNSTITNNSVNGGTENHGGALYSFASTVNVSNNILSGNSATEEIYLLGGGVVNSLGGNLIGGNAMLAPLGFYGGQTMTHALLSGSPAINNGANALAVDANNAPLTTDQRGETRIAGGTVDSGAYELQVAPTAASVSVSGKVTTNTGRGIKNVQITMIDANGIARTATSTTFGYYRFNNVVAGETLTITAKARQFRFNQSSIVRTANESINDADFVSEQ